MPKEDKQKLLKFLKLISLEMGINSKDNLIRVFGSLGSLESTLRKIRKIRLESAMSPLISLKSKKYLYDSDSVLDEYLVIILSGQIKGTEAIRYAKIIELLKRDKLSIGEITDKLNDSLCQGKSSLLELRTIRNYLKILVSDGFVEKVKDKKYIKYKLKKGLELLPEHLLVKLYLFTDFFSNTGLLVTRSLILKYFLEKRLGTNKLKRIKNVICYKHSKPLRVFDDLNVLYILNLLECKKACSLELSLLPKSKNKPLEKITVIPQFLLFDYQLARWYLITDGDTKRVLIDRIYEFRKVIRGSDILDSHLEKRLDNLKKSWLVEEDAKEKEIIIKFYFDSSKSSKNFILNRVKKEAMDGQIEIIDKNSFILKILTRELNEIKPWIRSFGSSAQVLEPRSLRNSLIEEFISLKSTYESVISEGSL
ncbi:WYL domain-containing protein [Thermodesulfobium acidiphilum]|uniref:WYL domain-containing protein n=1 Tax=Thermodesulfobium acidiphilum TaxID=1794699 RepID=A0A2R4W2R8_THEAF|nr:WYL domain-containing protein [Thermodesulfobium acidiphilum]AWB11030.1 WYL domain-containing protein [Thermodesulfobium acidiphilum]